MPTRGRRDFLGKALIGAASLSWLPGSAQAMASKLNPAEPAAALVGYVDLATQADAKRYATYKPGQNCGNCGLIMLQYGPWRPCKLFPGKLVSAKGWCNAWAKSNVR